MDATAAIGAYVNDVLAALGDAAPWFIGAVLIFVGALVAVAFAQGREVSLWPPRLGQRPLPPPGPEVESVASPMPIEQQITDSELQLNPQQPVVRAAGSPLFDEEFGIDNARTFYERIAANYDQRNSADLLKTHQAVVTQLKSCLRGVTGASILDLGGGTGKQIATQFFDHESLRWTYVDFSPAMVAQFQENLSGTPLDSRSEVLVADIGQVATRLSSRQFHVVLMSLVLSSMPSAPDFGALSALLIPGGHLIVADINPVYTVQNPHYAVLVAGSNLALRTNPVNPIALATEASAHGLRQIELMGVGQAARSYSFLAIFRKELADNAGETPE